MCGEFGFVATELWRVCVLNGPSACLASMSLPLGLLPARVTERSENVLFCDGPLSRLASEPAKRKTMPGGSAAAALPRLA